MPHDQLGTLQTQVSYGPRKDIQRKFHTRFHTLTLGGVDRYIKGLYLGSRFMQSIQSSPIVVIRGKSEQVNKDTVPHTQIRSNVVKSSLKKKKKQRKKKKKQGQKTIPNYKIIRDERRNEEGDHIHYQSQTYKRQPS